MCLRFQFCTHQRVCILYFLKKSQIRCTLILTLGSQTKDYTTDGQALAAPNLCPSQSLYQVKDGGREWTGRFNSQAYLRIIARRGGGRVSWGLKAAGNSLSWNFSYRAVGPPPVPNHFRSTRNLIQNSKKMAVGYLPLLLLDLVPVLLGGERLQQHLGRILVRCQRVLDTHNIINIVYFNQKISENIYTVLRIRDVYPGS